MEKLNLTKKNLRKFGITMGLIFLTIALLFLLRHKHHTLTALIISSMFFVLGYCLPGALRPIYIFWMKLAFILGWVNTRILLIILFYLVFAPLGLAMKLFRVDSLDRRIDKQKDSYWHKKEKKYFSLLNYERQF